MGFRFRKTFSLGKGVKLNLSKKSIGISAVVKGARICASSSGHVTKSASLPGTGISYVSSSKIGGTNKKTVKRVTII